MHLRSTSLFLCIVSAISALAQLTDTLRFRSAAFSTERTVVVHLPEFHRYAGAEVRMPVVILLDGQHEWLIDPLLNDIRYLQYTHEVPQAIVVTVPLTDRVSECAQDSITQPTMPLLRMITEELPPLLAPYNPGDLTVLVGHSFTASFALYAFLRAPDAFDAVIALSPAHQVSVSLPLVVDHLADHSQQRVLIAVGGLEQSKDGGHHALLKPAVASAAPERAKGRLIFTEYPSARHTSVPVVAFPQLLTTLFMPFSLRDSLAPVDGEYKLLSPPSETLLQDVEASCGFLGGTLPWEVAEINGLGSRIYSSGYSEQATAIFRHAVQLYPKFYEFHWNLGELLLTTDRKAGLHHLQEALRLLESEEPPTAERDDARREIEALMQK